MTHHRPVAEMVNEGAMASKVGGSGSVGHDRHVPMTVDIRRRLRRARLRSMVIPLRTYGVIEWGFGLDSAVMETLRDSAQHTSGG